MEGRPRKGTDHASAIAVDDGRPGIDRRQAPRVSGLGEGTAHGGARQQIPIRSRPDANLWRDHAPQARCQRQRRQRSPIYRAAHSHSAWGDHRQLAQRPRWRTAHAAGRSEEHTSELQSLMRISYAVFYLKKKNVTTNAKTT